MSVEAPTQVAAKFLAVSLIEFGLVLGRVLSQSFGRITWPNIVADGLDDGPGDWSGDGLGDELRDGPSDGPGDGPGDGPSYLIIGLHNRKTSLGGEFLGRAFRQSFWSKF